MSAASIADYAMIGDRRTAALVSRAGSIDWLCVPRFDAPACFASLLGTEDNGFWRIAPKDGAKSVSRRYSRDTLVLETEFETEGGRVRLTDFMAIDSETPTVMRIVTGLSGTVTMRCDVAVRFDYGHLMPWLDISEDGTLSAVAGPHRVVLHGPAGLAAEDHTSAVEFDVAEGESTSFTLIYCRSFEDVPAAPDAAQALKRTTDFWREWAGRCTYDGPWRDQVVRSLITLKALTYAPTGGIVAAPTTSLPEKVGGTRNWDYRFCWLRDATFTLLSFIGAGYHEEAEDWRAWLVRAVAGDVSRMQPLYTILGENRVNEWEADWLEGFGGARPVRIGNSAFTQVQLDNYGEVLDALHHARRNDLKGTTRSWELQKALMAHLETVKDEPGCGIWEVRGESRHFTHSKVMVWVAFDRAISAVEEFGLDGPVEEWRRQRDALHDEICEKGFDPELDSFVESYGSKALDAACLLFPLVGFLPADDARMVGTVKAIEKHLMVDGLVRRYDTSQSSDGLPEGEGTFIACSFWLADNYVLQGRTEDAERLFSDLLGRCNDVGLLAEEWETDAGTLIGNFPQGLSHLALVGTALNLGREGGPAHERPAREKPRQ